MRQRWGVTPNKAVMRSARAASGSRRPRHRLAMRKGMAHAISDCRFQIADFKRRRGLQSAICNLKWCAARCHLLVARGEFRQLDLTQLLANSLGRLRANLF